ncbi:DUF721 domain-containing protein [Agromyces seonyuensis]|uniref:DUF721 domain-containing protein n=1 Tax=Agromyces seonyuensis TaxID=2662446 RepID=A0A6I4P0B0_9MICO|nr:DciA family protein [Agromyces seonyuensis]MWB97449.1 DUF721 domain-containing protein [Agromyces seonyuensis]
MTAVDPQHDARPDPLAEAERVYRHFREIFGGAEQAPRRRPKRRHEPTEDLPFTPGRDPRPLGDALAKLTSELGWSAPLSQHALLASWVEIAGADIAAHSEPLAVEGPVLAVKCESTAWAVQLRLVQAGLVTRILEKFPESGVQSIRFQGPDAPSWKKGPRSVPGRGPRDTYG